MIKATQYIFESLIDVIFPNSCNFCGIPVEKRYYICESCELKLEKITGDTCERCGAPLLQNIHLIEIDNKKFDGCYNCADFDFSFKKNESLYIYFGYVRNLIHMYKFEKRWKLYKYFAEKLVSHKLRYINEFDIIVPIPLTKIRLKKRGYNQSSLIAKEISKKTGILYFKHLLNRKGHSKPQSSTNSVEERYKNMNDKISINTKYLEAVKGRSILLFDDILTTGLTASACANALYRKEAKNVSLLTLARTLK